MKVLAADDERLALRMLVDTLNRVDSNLEIHAYDNAADMLAFAKNTECDIAFLDIEMRDVNGIETAEELKQIYPNINIVFVTGYSEYMRDAFSLHASGYIVKPVTEKAIQKELNNLRFPPEQKEKEKDCLHIQTFGNFEIFYKGKPLHFKRAKSKEVIAYLIDRKGACVTMAELAATLWEDKEYNRSLLNQIHSFLSDIMKLLKEVGQENAIIKERNNIAINMEQVECDYYKLIKGDTHALNSYAGEYMTNYSWAEFTIGSLNELVETMREQ